MIETELITKHLKPLARGDQWLLANDGALTASFNAAASDCMVEDVHFVAGTKPQWLAQKLVRVNLSDFAAMGATPKAYLLTIGCEPKIAEKWIKGFAAGLGLAQKEFEIYLAGGDLSRSSTNFASITILGTHAPKPLTRSGARVGDSVFVSGTIGVAVARQYDILPNPRLELGKMLTASASSAIDLSDGLVMDLERICLESKCSMEIDLGAIPIEGKLETAINGGEDYELAFTSNASSVDEISKNTPITKIGRVIPVQKHKILTPAGKPLQHKGFHHF